MKTRSKARAVRPALTFGHVALWAASGAIGAFGVMGWVDGADTLASKILLAMAAGFSAVVVPAIVHHIGRGFVSLLLVVVALPFLAITAASTHNGWSVEVEEKREAVAVADEAHAVAIAQGKLNDADIALAGLKLVLPVCPNGCAQSIRDTTKAWTMQREPLAAQVEARKAELAIAEGKLSAARAAHQPMASDLAVWLVGSSIDVAIALGLAVLSIIVRRKPHVEAKPKRSVKKTHQAKPATAPVGRKDWKPRVVS